MDRSLPVALGLALALSLLACSRPPCEETCRKVASCKLERTQGGERMLGERAPPADPTCLSRCEAATPEFAACEGKKRECAALLECLPYR